MDLEASARAGAGLFEGLPGAVYVPSGGLLGAAYRSRAYRRKRRAATSAHPAGHGHHGGDAVLRNLVKSSLLLTQRCTQRKSKAATAL
ncbi:MAG TPA: hypothetical protein VHW74_03170 [Mycobacteriales bacterium]|nr:hypothetical protein [Mycobacteriales bacterium]